MHFSYRDLMMLSKYLLLLIFLFRYLIISVIHRRYLRDTLKMANFEELNRLTSCSLVLLGHIFYSLSNCKESLNMVVPAMQLASRMSDVHVQLWATALLTDLYNMSNDYNQAQKQSQMHQGFVQALLNDTYKASSLTEHNYIHWTGEGA